MPSSSHLRFASTANEVRAGEALRGALLLSVARPRDVRRIQLRWRLEGAYGVRVAYTLAPVDLYPPVDVQALPPGEHRLPFEVRAPSYPPTVRGTLVLARWRLEARGERGWRRTLVAQHWVELRPGAPADRVVLSRLARLRARRLPPSVVVGALLVGPAVVCLVTLLSWTRGAGVWRLALLGALAAAGLAAWLGGRRLWNRLAEQRLGDVFVSVPAQASLDAQEPIAVRVPRALHDVLVHVDLVREESAVMAASRERGGGVSRRRHRAVLASQRLVPDPDGEFHRGTLDLAPLELPPSLDLGDLARIEYWIEVRIEVPAWPDWVHRYRLELAPPTPKPAPVPVAIGPIAPRRVPLTCPYCKDGLEGVPREQLLQCGDCRTVLHAECVIELGRCTTVGCSRNQARRGRQRAR